MSKKLNELVKIYIKSCRAGINEELKYWAEASNLSTAIKKATLSRLGNNKKHRHQSRIREKHLRRAASVLLARREDIFAAPTFESLSEIIGATFQPGNGIGELAVYDFAIRIGAFLKLQPNEVHLHRGTRDGARMLDFHDEHTIPLKHLPRPLQQLSPIEIEDFLCVFRDCLGPQQLKGPVTKAFLGSMRACCDRSSTGC